MPDNLRIEEKLEKLNKIFPVIQGRLVDSDDAYVRYNEREGCYQANISMIASRDLAEKFSGIFIDRVLAVKHAEIEEVKSWDRFKNMSVAISNEKPADVYNINFKFNNDTCRRLISFSKREIDNLIDESLACYDIYTTLQRGFKVSNNQDFRLKDVGYVKDLGEFRIELELKMNKGEADKFFNILTEAISADVSEALKQAGISKLIRSSYGDRVGHKDDFDTHRLTIGLKENRALELSKLLVKAPRFIADALARAKQETAKIEK